MSEEDSKMKMEARMEAMLSNMMACMGFKAKDKIEGVSSKVVYGTSTPHRAFTLSNSMQAPVPP